MAYSVPTENEIRTALIYIDATERQTWVSVGTALKTEFGETGFNLFDEWSQTAQNYKSRDAKDAWRSFRIGKSNIGYIINQAKQNGWVREKQQPMNANEMAERQRRNEAIAKQAENQRIKAQKAAEEYAQNIWNKAKPVNPNHAYLQKKGINNPSVLVSIRQDKDALILPLRNRGEIVGIQKIFANGDKRFNRDIEKKGSALIIGNRDEMQHGFLMAEGFATAATLHIATGKPVVVAFDAGNLKEVSGSLKEFVQNHQTPVLICADKDESQTGEIKAKTAADVLGNNATVITPDFSETEIQNFQAVNNGKKPTDFNDLQAIDGIERVKNSLSGRLNDVTLATEQIRESVMMTEEMPKPERAEWEKDFPKAVTNDLKGNLIDLPNYQAAKSGDAIAALNLVQQALNDETVKCIQRQFILDKDTLIVPVNALEEAGKNPIPMTLAYELSNHLGLEVYTDIVQATKVARTRKSADYRLAFPPAFTGEVLPNRNYLIVDDTLIQGGTIESLRGYINNRGGKVIGVAVLSAKEHSLQLAPTVEILQNIENKFGDELNQFWQKEFNYGINQLTNSEAVVLSKGDDFISIRNRIAQELLSGSSEHLQTATEVIPAELHNIIKEIKSNNPNHILRLETAKDACQGRVFYETENFVIQQVADNSRFFQAWNKQDLDIPLKIGDKAKIYLDKQGKAQIKITQQTEEPNPETPRPPQGGFVLPVESSNTNNRQPENHPAKEMIMAEQNKLTPSAPLEKHTFTPGTWQPETPTFENRIDFADDRQMVMDEVERANKPEITHQETVQAAFEILQNQYHGYRFHPDNNRLEIENSPTKEAIHLDDNKLIYTAEHKGARQTIGDIDIKDLSPEYLALSVENRRLAYNQTLLQNGFPNEEKRQVLDQTADRLDESIREAHRKTETLKPPIAPPPPLDQRYTAVERKFLDNTTHYGDRTNLGIKTRVDYVDVNNSRTVLFSDKGNKLTTSKNPDAQTVKDMVELVKTKGWDSVKLRGNKEFKRMAYIEMESQGIKTKGYSPSKEDLAMVEKSREERSLSGIENISGCLNNKPQPPEQNLSQEAKAFFDELHKNPTAEKGGILLAHGKDNFQFKKNASKSYFATIQYPDGEKTYWGKDIERVLQENNINKGDRIDLSKTDRFEPVRVREVVKDKHGKPVLDENGQPKTEEAMHKRNVWEIKVYEKNNPDVQNGLNQETKQPESTVMASKQSERGNLGTQENNRLNQEIATPATQVRNDENLSGSLNEQKIAQQEINNAEYQAKKNRAYAYDRADKWEHLAMAQNDGEPVSQMQDEVQDMKYFAERGVSDSQVLAKSVVQGQSTQRKNISIRDVYHQRLNALPKAHRTKILENEKVARAMFAFIDNPDEQKKAMENFYRTNAQEMGNTLQQLQGKEQERNQSLPTPEHSHQDDYEMER